MKNLVLPVLLALSMSAFAQKPANDWHHQDPSSGSPGVSTQRAYEAVKGKPSKTVVVAVIDSGVDAEHEDLSEVMWTNPGEIADNGKDDDGNGYIDDIHGWNFIGGPDGTSVNFDTYEATRVYATLKPKYDGTERKKWKGKARKEYDLYIKLKEDVETKREAARPAIGTEMSEEQAQMQMFLDALTDVNKALSGKPFTPANVEGIDAGENMSLIIGKEISKQIFESGEDLPPLDSIILLVKEEMAAASASPEGNEDWDYHFNPEYNTRALIVKDNYADMTQRVYGNNDVRGTDAMHGTHVAGIIGAKRGNGKGMDGIADNVRIMSVRVVPPSGDERDKDVANAIRYAVDNGATVINMSFGKGLSPNKEVVDAAIRYAAEHDVLLVHAAGNSNNNNDTENNFPTAKISRRKEAKNWIEIGAASYKGGENFSAPFSNYGPGSVDVFSPGVQIYATLPDNNYAPLSGTSMASPVTAGVAALIRSRYPDLTAEQIKEILTASITPIEGKVKRPGDNTMVTGKDLCRSGGSVNAANAMALAEKTKPKKKPSKANTVGAMGGTAKKPGA